MSVNLYRNRIDFYLRNSFCDTITIFNVKLTRTKTKITLLDLSKMRQKNHK